MITRQRPGSSSDSSFPSSHAAAAFSLSAWANRQWDTFDLSPAARTTAKVTNVALATGVGWARVEAGRHFPSDVLAGAAIGNFLTRFIDHLVPVEREESNVSWSLESVTVDRGGAGIVFSVAF